MSDYDAMQYFDRDIQREILSRLLRVYPQEIEIGGWRDEIRGLLVNAAYLDGHGLIEMRTLGNTIGAAGPLRARATVKGADFMADDGGLSAILGVVTIRLHDDTLKALIEKKIQDSEAAPEDKRRWLAALRSLPADATKHLVLQLVERGLDRSGDAMRWLGSTLSTLG